MEQIILKVVWRFVKAIVEALCVLIIWGITDGNVACGQLGFHQSGQYFTLYKKLTVLVQTIVRLQMNIVNTGHSV